MYSKVLSAAVQGIDAYVVKVEIHLDPALYAYTTVGLPDNAVKESRERVSAAIKNSGFLFPSKKITVNLAPAGIRKEGASFDLPIALGLLAATGQVSRERLSRFAVLGELALDGTIRPIHGALSIATHLITRKLDKGLGNPDYNYMIRSVPQDRGETAPFHWYLSLVVRLSYAAGFELGSGMFINTTLPEESARFLNRIEL